MKRRINPFKILALAAVIALPALSRAAGNEDGSEKKKTISKSYTVGPNEKLKIENSFGDVVINTWDKNEFKIDIEMYAKATSDERAQYMLDHIKVEDSQSENTVRFKTDVHINGNHNDGDDDDNDGDDDKGDKKNRSVRRHGYTDNQQFHINYVVYMPSTNPLELMNSFGKTTVPDFKGLANITSKFGSLTAGNLSNVDAIDVEFGKADIGDVHNGKITFKFDDKSTVGKLSGTVKITNEFSGNLQYNVGTGIEDLMINDSYSSVRVVVPKDLSASFTIHTNFGDFHNNTDFGIHEASEDDDNSGPKFDKDFAGTVGGGKARIKIKSSFGDVRLTHEALSKDEMEKERAEKKERKERKERKETKESDESK
ncbi:MAG: hypothetical protein JST87_12840 [Bacteroidetes bacterium]|nr:hypothetical protein [Bacteroidota bacterium]